MLAYRRHGPPGEPVLLLHPWFGCPGFWNPVLDVLAAERCLVVDLYSPARGDWTAVANPRSLADGIRSVLDAEGAASARLVGNSMGGILAQLVAAEQPARVRKLVLVGPGAASSGLQSEFAARLQGWLESRDPAGLEMLTRGLVAPGAAKHPVVEACLRHLASVDADYISAVPRATLGLDLRPLLASISAPTLVIRGELDGIRTRAHAEELVAGIPDAHAEEIPGAGHSPMVDATADFNRLLSAFLTP
jgi:pimeloyl-ACP methyl ester carboxylesterase